MPEASEQCVAELVSQSCHRVIHVPLRAQDCRGGGAVPRRRGGRDRQPIGRARRVGRRHHRHRADETRGGRRRHRRRLPRLPRDRQAAVPGLPPSPQRTHQPDPAPGAGHQLVHRLRRHGGVARRHLRGRRRRRHRDPCRHRRRSGRRGGGDDCLRGLRHRAGQRRAQHPGPVPAHRRTEPHRLRRLARGPRPLRPGRVPGAAESASRLTLRGPR